MLMQCFFKIADNKEIEISKMLILENHGLHVAANEIVYQRQRPLRATGITQGIFFR